MPEPTPTGAVDIAKRQVRRVRRRKNLYELQRTLYLTIAAGTAAATMLLPLALFAPAAVFAIAAWGALGVLGGVALLLAGAARRRWLARGAAVAWIETQGALAGRLRTLLELAPRPAAAAGFFHALLVAEIGRDLATWAPRRLVPRRVPRAALVTALMTTGVLVAALRLAALAVPVAPEVIFSNEPLAGARADAPYDAMTADRVVVAPGVPPSGGEQPSPAADDTRDDDSTLTRLPNALQENVRQQVWGKAWERVREALAHAGTPGGSGSTRAPQTEYGGDETGADESEEWEIARAPSGELTRRRRPGIGRQPTAHPDGATDPDAADTAPRSDAGTAENEGGEGGGGAGSGTAPDLFGAPSADSGPGSGSFELSLAARMRADRGTERRAGGPAPAPDADARPELAAGQRRESAAHRMAVPAAYETVVREVFAHREHP